MVKKLWKEFYANEYEGIIDYINNFVVKIKDAADHDFIKVAKRKQRCCNSEKRPILSPQHQSQSEMAAAAMG